MDFANGTVKKYSREYTRTLKNGKKKKYNTEQVQVTVPKAENIFEDAENVILIRKSDFTDFEDIEETMVALEFFNTILTENNQILEDELSKNKDIIDEFNSQVNDPSEEVSELQKELDSKNLIIEDLNSKIDLFRDELESKNFIISDLEEELKSKENINNLDNLTVDDLSSVSDLDNLNSTSDVNNNDYIELQRDFIRLSKKFELIQEELFNVKVNALHYKNLANKYKKFILKFE